MWAAPLGLLEREREVIAVDLPGFGDSPSLHKAPTPSALADAVEETITELGLSRPAVAGNSLGGLIALELAHRSAVSSCVALSPAGFANSAEAAVTNVNFIVSRFAARELTGVVPRLSRHPAWRDALAAPFAARPSSIPPDEFVVNMGGLAWSPGFDATRREVRRARWTHSGAIPVPTTIAWAERDMILFPWQARRAEALLPDTTFTTLHGCGHVPCWDDPPLVARTILEGTSPT